MSNYRILVDLVDQSEKSDILVSLTNLSSEWFELKNFLEILKNSQYNYDLYFNLQGQELNQLTTETNLQTFNIFNHFPHHMLITYSQRQNCSNPHFLHLDLAQQKRKRYQYFLTIDGQQLIGLRFLLANQQQLEKALLIMHNRFDLAVLGSRDCLDYLDEDYREQIETIFNFKPNHNPYLKKQQVLNDFLDEYYEQPSSSVLNHHIKVNNYFTCFQSFNLTLQPPGFITVNNNSIIKQLAKLLGSNRPPKSTQLIEIIYQQLNIPQYLNNNILLIKYHIWLEFYQFLKNRELDRLEFDVLKRVFAVYLKQSDYWIGGINVGKIIRPQIYLACHFKKLDNLIIKLKHIKHLHKMGDLTIIYSSQSGTCKDTGTCKNTGTDISRDKGTSKDKCVDATDVDANANIQSILNWCQEQNIKTIHDYENNGLDFGKWLKGLEKHNNIKSEWIWLTNDSWFSGRNLTDYLAYYSGTTDFGLIGLTDSLERLYHIQSYSWLINRRYITDFIQWNQNTVRSDYQSTVDRNEIGFCQKLLSSNIRITSYFSTVHRYRYNLFNSPIYCNLVQENKFPLVKLRFWENKDNQATIQANFLLTMDDENS